MVPRRRCFCARPPVRRYSAQRLVAFRDYCASVSRLRVVLVPLLFGVPVLALALAVELVPLQDPRESWRANGGYWTRIFAGTTVVSASVLARALFVIPELAFSRARVAGISLATATGYTLALMLLAELWRFPIPFTYTLGSVPLVLIFNVFVVASTGTADAALLRKCAQYSHELGVQGALLLVYPTYNALFVSLEGPAQLLLVLLLPVIKYAFKYVTLKVRVGADDLATADLTSVDFFDALYMTKCMQSGTTLVVGLAIIVVDTAQNCVAILHLAKQTRTLKSVRASARLQDRSGATGCPDVPLGAAARTELLPWVLAALQRVGRSASVSLRLPSASATARQSPGGPTVAFVVASRQGNAVVPAPPEAEQRAAAKPQDEVAVQETLRLLHLSEVAIVVEYVETVVPIVYAIYSLVLVHLPSVRFHPDMHALAAAGRLHSAVLNILAYASMELLSMLYVHATLKRHFGISVLDQLSFTLERDLPIIQGCIVTWGLVVFQYLLVHNGVDCGFLIGA